MQILNANQQLCHGELDCFGVKFDFMFEDFCPEIEDAQLSYEEVMLGIWVAVNLWKQELASIIFLHNLLVEFLKNYFIKINHCLIATHIAFSSSSFLKISNAFWYFYGVCLVGIVSCELQRNVHTSIRTTTDLLHQCKVMFRYLWKWKKKFKIIQCKALTWANCFIILNLISV